MTSVFSEFSGEFPECGVTIGTGSAFEIDGAGSDFVSIGFCLGNGIVVEDGIDAEWRPIRNPMNKAATAGEIESRTAFIEL